MTKQEKETAFNLMNRLKMLHDVQEQLYVQNHIIYGECEIIYKNLEQKRQKLKKTYNKISLKKENITEINSQIELINKEIEKNYQKISEMEKQLRQNDVKIKCLTQEMSKIADKIREEPFCILAE